LKPEKARQSSSSTDSWAGLAILTAWPIFSEKGYKVVIPELPIFTAKHPQDQCEGFAKFVKDFITYKGFDRVILLGNSLGGHIALYHTKMYPEKMLGLVITGSSGFSESAMGDSYPRRGDRDYIQKKQKTYSMIPKSQRLKSEESLHYGQRSHQIDQDPDNRQEP
jgi:pimeloyl-ACP methyl ester carboxylesterase